METNANVAKKTRVKIILNKFNKSVDYKNCYKYRDREGKET
jgi:hypothetical protein